MKELLKELYNSSAYTILGCGGDIEEWKKGYNDILEREGIGKVNKFYKFTGKDINEFMIETYGKENVRDFIQEDLTCLAFKLDNLNIGRLAILKLRLQDRWFDDLIDNRINKGDEEDE